MSANPQSWSVDFATYLRFEREAAERHELIDGEIIAMAGATRRHNMLCGRLNVALVKALGDGPCILQHSDQRLAVLSSARGWVGYYPDLAVYCTDEVHPLDSDTRLNPTLLVEVTSKSTEKKDRGVKLDDYLQVAALEEYLIVAYQRNELELWTRTATGWTRHVVSEGTLRLKNGAVLDINRLYSDLPS